MRLEQRDEWNNRPYRDAYSLPDIPDSELFQHNRAGFEKPVEIHGWQWSSTFGKWSALVTFSNGWHGFTYPKTF